MRVLTSRGLYSAVQVTDPHLALPNHLAWLGPMSQAYQVPRLPISVWLWGWTEV